MKIILTLFLFPTDAMENKIPIEGKELLQALHDENEEHHKTQKETLQNQFNTFQSNKEEFIKIKTQYNATRGKFTAATIITNTQLIDTVARQSQFIVSCLKRIDLCEENYMNVYNYATQQQEKNQKSREILQEKVLFLCKRFNNYKTNSEQQIQLLEEELTIMKENALHNNAVIMEDDQEDQEFLHQPLDDNEYQKLLSNNNLLD